jgi:hypothetical protein
MRFCLLGLACVLTPFAALAAPPVFTDAPASSDRAIKAIQHITRAARTRDATVRTARINRALFSASAGDAFTLPIGPGFRLVTRKVTAHPDGSASWTGSAVNGHGRYATTLTRAKSGMVVGRIATPDATVQVLAADGRLSLITRYGWRPAPRGKDTRAPVIARHNPAHDRRRAVESVTSPRDSATITLLIAYSPAVAAAHSQALKAWFHNLVDAANAAFAASGIQLTLKLAGTLEVPFGDGMSASDLLYCASGEHAGAAGCPSRAVDNIKAMRALHAADLVMMMAKTTGDAVNDTAGIAFEGGAGGCGAHPYCFSADFGYAAMLIGFRDQSTFTHELGHDLGAGHNLNAPDHDGAFSYSHGHRYGGNNGTVMAYADHQNLLFSSPDYDCGGASCGNARTQDNALTIKKTMGLVAAYSEHTLDLSQVGRAHPGGRATLEVTGGNGAVIGPAVRVFLLKNGKRVATLVQRARLDGSSRLKLPLPVNLAPGATYAFAFEPIYRPAQSFSAPLDVTFKAPAVTAFKAARIGQTQASFKVAANPRGLDTTLALAAGDVASSATVKVRARADHDGGDIRLVTLTDLACGTRVTARLAAKSAAGASRRRIRFKTLPCAADPPVISGSTPGAGGRHTRAVAVEAAPDGASAADVAVVYGRSGGFDGQSSDWRTLQSGGSLSFKLNDLNCSATYHYRVLAYSAAGAARGAPGTFTTAACRAGTLSIAGPASINAGAGVAVFTVTRDDGSDGAVAVDYQAIPGSARRNREFLQTAGTLIFKAGQTTGKIKVPILLQPTDRGAREFKLVLSNPTGGARLAGNRAVNTTIHYPARLTPASETTKDAKDGPPAADDTGGGGSAGGLALLFLGCVGGFRRMTKARLERGLDDRVDKF